ncbi:hypothetical protein MBLNU459_g4855t1 [Dothideomycetes sp. NU459]
MASEAPINGNYAPHQGYGSIEQNHGGYTSGTAPHQTYSNSSQAAATASSTASEIPKDEVGWYFVEQYYTTLSRSPEKLYLFYNKRSQYVSGNETEKVAVSVGQRAINDRIKEHDFQDCKVRVTNVDSQASDEHIVIQVIGEISNKSAPHKKFTQTFVLAGQTNGYFVLNDIFRYIVEEEEEVEIDAEAEAQADAAADDLQQEPAAQPAPAAVEQPSPAAAQQTETEPKTLTSSSDPAAVEHDAAKVDQELEANLSKEQPAAEETAPPPAAVNGDVNLADADIAHAEEAPAAAVPAAKEPEAPATSEPAATEAAVQDEKPKDPEPTPAKSPVKQAPAKPATPVAPTASAKPAAPKTWANLAAAAHRVATPAVAVPQPSSSAAPQQAKAAPVPATAASTASSPAPASAPAREPSPAPSQQDEWTSVGGDHKKQQAKGQASSGSQDGPQNRAYIKNVHESIDTKELRSLLEKFGEIVYFDVARQKNCAFVDFKTAEGYKAAVDANPHQIGNDRVMVEERRLKPGAYPYVQRGGMRGGRGAPNQGPNRGSFQGGRGGFPPRGRGNNAARGRGGAQAA